MSIGQYICDLKEVLIGKYSGCILVHTRSAVDVENKSLGKCPAVAHKTVDEAKLWETWDKVGVHVCEKGTALIVRKTIIVFDIDAEDWCEKLEGLFPIIKKTVIQKTRTGRHYFFKRSMDCDVHKIYDKARCLFDEIGNVLPIDIKTVCSTGTGGIISIFPSPNKSWINSIIDHDLLELPDSLLQFVLKHSKHSKQTKSVVDTPTDTASERSTEKSFVTIPSSNSVFIAEVKQLVAILSKQRSDNYRGWMEVGWCLHNISETLLQTWITFSKQSSSFKPGECEGLWQEMLHEGLGLGSLHMWAKHDDPYEYKMIINKRVFDDIKSCNGRHNAVAAIAYKILNGRYVYTSKVWFHFNGTLWQEDSEALKLRHELSTTVKQHFICATHKIPLDFTLDDLESTGTTAQKKQNDVMLLCEKILKTGNDLQDAHFKDNVVKELKEFFCDPEFLKKLDSKPNLLGFNNGVWDLDVGAFRTTVSEDWLSLTVGFDYSPVMNVEHKEKVENYWSKLHPSKEQRAYVINTFARQLYGDNGSELFHIHAGFQGAAGNGKTKFFEVLENCLGNYVRKFPVQVLTAKVREEAGKPAPEYQYWRGRRVLFCSEPKDDDILHSGIMKDLTGGEQILYRLLFSNDVHTFRPQYKMHIMCNDPPKVDGSDEGVRRRIRKIDYVSRFVDRDKVNEAEFFFARDGSFFDELKASDGLKMEVLRLFLDAFSKENDFKMTQAIADNSKMYLDDNNPVHAFVEKCVRSDKNGYFTLAEAKEVYKENSFCQSKIGKLKGELEKILRVKCLEQKRCGKDSEKKKNVFCGFKLVRFNDDDLLD
jgi:phage/plasmid-associated DNA primase